jgi:hypothetical protein
MLSAFASDKGNDEPVELVGCAAGAADLVRADLVRVRAV